MRRVAVAVVVVMLTVVSGPDAGLCRDTGSWLKSSYLKSIHDDCRTLIEGIELFIKRDYAQFMRDVHNRAVISHRDTNNYINELKYFKSMLDSLYEEYISFKTAALVDANGAVPANALSGLEKSLNQMFAYAYIRTGDVIMAQRLMANKDIMSENVSIKMRNIEGLPIQFALTKALQQEAKTTINTLGMLTLHVKNFLETDRQEINTYLKISGYNTKDPVNIMYMAYCGQYFPGLESGKDKMIHIGQVVELMNTLKYKTARPENISTDSNDSFHAVYRFPIINGDYELIIRDPHIRAYSNTDDEVTIERLCLFKGLARTDFRRLKQAEKQQQDAEQIVEETLSLVKAGKEYVSYKPGQMVPYDIYALYEKNQYLGTINMLPCSKGGTCKKNTAGKGVTPIPIPDHTLILYRDTLDLITRNNKIYEASAAATPDVNKQIGLFSGCASTSTR